MIDAKEIKYSKVIILKETEEYSIAVLNYCGKTRYGIRWNGDGENIGTPTSHGKPTWFILPSDIVELNIKINNLGENK